MRNQRGSVGIIVAVIIPLGLLVAGYYYFGKPAVHTPTINQGLYGVVTLYGGNCMPTVAGMPKTPKATGCSTSFPVRTIYIRELTKTKTFNGVYSENKTNLIQQTKSNGTGFYQVDLPPGTYSVFVEDAEKEYCNFLSSKNELCPVTVGTGRTEYNIKIDHAAW